MFPAAPTTKAAAKVTSTTRAAGRSARSRLVIVSAAPLRRLDAGLSPLGRATPGRAHQQREPEEERDLGSDHPSLPLDELAELGAAGRGGVANAVGQLGDGAGELSDLPQGHAVSLQESPGDAPLKRSHTLQHGLAPGHLLRGPIS